MKKKRIHFMGVGGAGCSAVFAIAKASGYQVSGCDKEKDSPYLDRSLKDLVSTGHDPSHLRNVDALVYSPAVTAFDFQNEELTIAQKKGLPILPWDKFLADEILTGKFVIAVAGTHGKGTVTSMIGVVMEKAGLDPTCMVGAVVSEWGRNYRIGAGRYFVVEADEFSEKLLRFSPNIAVITNIEFDHPEYFKDLADLKGTFKKFTYKLKKGSILVAGPGVDLENPRGRTKKATTPLDIEIGMIGEFNKINAAIAATVAKELGISGEKIEFILAKFKGLARRFEFKGQEKGILVFDDYAHHPTAVAKTLQAARDKFPDKRLWLVYQPHLYTRTKRFLADFVAAFEAAPIDEIIIVDIFGAREKDSDQISSANVVQAVKRKGTRYIADWRDAASLLVKEVSAADVVITMGAGDIYQLPNIFLKKLANKI